MFLCIIAPGASSWMIRGSCAPPLAVQRGLAPRMVSVGLKEDVAVLDAEEAEVPDGVVCARGVCVIAEPEAPEVCRIDDDGSIQCEPNPDAAVVKPWWPSALLLGCSVLYGTNFPLGRLMNDAMPASAASSARFALR